ncbi:MAG: AbrB/MazE/SpoVT family DNA-binding domain-containing protein, partial [Planctomycetia bacterium]|nr:AbrB/MazE/SpoVT family DNA-binding domain-containing protein [Planctomycetia bacterium]
MELAKITSKGQITIPLTVRKSMGLKEGDKIMFFEDENGYRIVNAAMVALQKVQKAFEGEA